MYTARTIHGVQAHAAHSLWFVVKCFACLAQVSDIDISIKLREGSALPSLTITRRRHPPFSLVGGMPTVQSKPIQWYESWWPFLECFDGMDDEQQCQGRGSHSRWPLAESTWHNQRLHRQSCMEFLQTTPEYIVAITLREFGALQEWEFPSFPDPKDIRFSKRLWEQKVICLRQHLTAIKDLFATGGCTACF